MVLIGVAGAIATVRYFGRRGFDADAFAANSNPCCGSAADPVFTQGAGELKENTISAATQVSRPARFSGCEKRLALDPLQKTYTLPSLLLGPAFPLGMV